MRCLGRHVNRERESDSNYEGDVVKRKTKKLKKGRKKPAPPACTAVTSGGASIKQRFFRCQTCDNSMVCLGCSRVCHSGHQLSAEKFGSANCHCGKGGVLAFCMITPQQAPPKEVLGQDTLVLLTGAFEKPARKRRRVRRRVVRPKPSQSSASSSTSLKLSSSDLSSRASQSTSSRVSSGSASSSSSTSADRGCRLLCGEEGTVTMTPHCGHYFCQECAVGSLKNILDIGQFPARCPACHAADTTPGGDDKSRIDASLLYYMLSKGMVDQDFVDRFVMQQLIHACPLVTCPQCNTVGAQSITPDRAVLDVQCNNCQLYFCAKCVVPWHKDMTCVEYQAAQAPMDDATSGLLTHTSQGCPQCGTRVTHYRGHGCHHIRGCNYCGLHFCYVCLQNFPCNEQGHSNWCDPTCGCPTCPDCKPGQPCANCPGGFACPSCSGAP